MNIRYKTVGFVALIAVCSLLIDPYAYNSITAPKNLVFTIGAPFLLFFSFLRIKSIKIGIIPILYLLRIAWLALTNPEWLTHPSNDGFYISVGILCWLIFAGQLKSDSDKELFFSVLFWIGIIETAIGIGQIISYVPNPSFPMKTPFIGTFGTPNGLGIFLAVSFLSGLYLIYSSLRNYWMGIGTLFLLTGIFLSESRGSLLALISALVLVLVVIGYHKRSLFKRRWITISGIVIIGVSSVFLYQADSKSTSGRWMIWEITGLMISEQPFIGVGQGNYSVEYLIYQAKYFEDPAHTKNEVKAANIKQAHNEFLQSIAEGGVLSAVLFVLIWVIPFLYLYRRLIKGIDYVLLTQLAIHTSIFIHALLDSPLHVLPVAIVGYSNIALLSKDRFHIQTKGIKRIALLIIVAFYLLFTSVKQLKKYPGHHYWKKGVDHITKLEWRGSVADLNKALEYLPNKGEVLHKLGSSHIFIEEYSRGLYYLEESKKYFNDRNIYLSESYGFIKLKKYKQAEESAKKALGMFPTHLAPHLMLGEIYFYQGRFEESKQFLQKCIDEDIPIKSIETKQISEDAKKIWVQFYGIYTVD